MWLNARNFSFVLFQLRFHEVNTAFFLAHCPTFFCRHDNWPAVGIQIYDEKMRCQNSLKFYKMILSSSMNVRISNKTLSPKQIKFLQQNFIQWTNTKKFHNFCFINHNHRMINVMRYSIHPPIESESPFFQLSTLFLFF